MSAADRSSVTDEIDVGYPEGGQNTPGNDVTNEQLEISTFVTLELNEILIILETYFTCAICKDIYIQPTVIACGHTFCDFCIGKCAQEKNNCPLCRKSFSAQETLVGLGDFLEKFYQKLPPQIGDKRKVLIEEREEERMGEQQRQTAFDDDTSAAIIPNFFNPRPNPIMVTGLPVLPEAMQSASARINYDARAEEDLDLLVGYTHSLAATLNWTYGDGRAGRGCQGPLRLNKLTSQCFLTIIIIVFVTIPLLL